MNRLTSLCTGLICAVALMLVAQVIEPEYTKWDRKQLEAAYVAKLEEASKLRRDLAVAKKQLADAQKPTAEEKQEQPADEQPKRERKNTVPITNAKALHVEVLKAMELANQSLAGREIIFDGKNCDWRQQGAMWTFMARADIAGKPRTVLFLRGQLPAKPEGQVDHLLIRGNLGEIKWHVARADGDSEITVSLAKVIDITAAK